MVRKGGVLAMVATCAVAATGCATREEQVVIADPLAEALAHAPADAAVLTVVATDTAAGPGGTLARLGRRFPGIDLVLGQAQAALGARVGLEYATELRPLLGHPLVLWSAEGLAGPRFAAWVVRDGAKLGELLDARLRSGALVAAPAAEGYALYTRRGGGAYARRGPLLVSAPDLARLNDVLRRRQAGRGQWSLRLGRERGLGLSEDGAVARVALDARTLVARGGGTARRVPWVAALRRAALTVTPEAGGLRVHARASTDAGALTPADVPLAPGVEPPVTRGSGPVVAAVRDPSQTLRFVRRVVELLDPQRLDGLRQAEEVLARFARVSVQEELVDRLAGSATLTSRDGRTFTIRADLDRPEVTAAALDRLGTVARLGGPLANLAGVDLGGIGVDEQAGGRTVLTRDGKLLVALAVIEGALVASTDPTADLAAAARAPAGRPPPTAGAFRATVGAALLTDQLVRPRPPRVCPRRPGARRRPDRHRARGARRRRRPARAARHGLRRSAPARSPLEPVRATGDVPDQRRRRGHDPRGSWPPIVPSTGSDPGAMRAETDAAVPDRR